MSAEHYRGGGRAVFALAVLLVLLVLLVAPAAVPAQGVRLSGVITSAGHELLGNPLSGGAIGLEFRRRGTPLSFQLEVTRSHGDAGRVGIACAGLIWPGTCGRERLRDDARLTNYSGGAAFRVLGNAHVSVALTADLSLAAVRVDTRGLSSGRTLSASKRLWGGLLGARAAWVPVSGLPIALEVAGGVGFFLPTSYDTITDGYTPFEQGFGIRQGRLGVAWTP